MAVAPPTPPVARRVRPLLVLVATVVAVAVVRDRLIAAAERREATRLGLDEGR